MDGIDAGRLIAFACDIAATPGTSGNSAEYTRLIERYLSDAVFARLVDDFAEGVGCDVVHAGVFEGLILSSHPDGPWSWPKKSGDLPWNKTFKSQTDTERGARMLVIPALLAYIAPSAADFDDLLADPTRLPPPVSVRHLEAFIRSFAEHMESGSPDPTGDERPMWWHWVQTAAEPPTAKRISRASTAYVVYDVLNHLHSTGLLVKTAGSTADDTVYRPRRRILFHYRDILVDDLFTMLRSFAAEEN